MNVVTAFAIFGMVMAALLFLSFVAWVPVLWEHWQYRRITKRVWASKVPNWDYFKGEG